MEFATTMVFVVFVISGLSVCVGYGLSLLMNHYQLKESRAEAAAAREDAKICAEVERKELTEFVTHVQSVAAAVDGNVDRHTNRVAAINEAVVNNSSGDSSARANSSRQPAIV